MFFRQLFRTALLLALVPALFTSCAGRQASPTVSLVDTASSRTGPLPSPTDAAPEPTPAQDRTYVETGTAGWYGRELHGRKTASGEVFDMFGLSASHRTLPLGVIIRVTNLDNFKSVEVKINDRGPFIKNSILDLSYGAAKELGFAAQGIAHVRIETSDSLRRPAQYTVQAAIFTEEESARLLKERLDARFETVTITTFETNVSRFYRVRVGAYASEERAETVAGKLRLEGLEPFVARKD